jgi:uncharacterized BrkB/YihY/UPF0761 family membrane protein
MASEARSRAEALRDLGLRASELAKTRVPGAPAVVESLERERAVGSGLLAGGLAYRLFLWLVPYGLVLAGIASFWSDTDPEGVESAARHFGLGGAAARSARSAFDREAHNRWYLLGAGIVLLVWFGMSAMRALRIVNAIAWAERPSKLRKPLDASLAFCGFVIGVTFLGAFAQWLRGEVGQPAELIVTLTTLAVYCGAALSAMWLLPHGGAPWQALVPGVFVVAVGLLLMQVVVTLYLAPKLSRSPSLYGALGGATVVLLWLYLIARLIVSAAFFNATLWDRKQRGT